MGRSVRGEDATADGGINRGDTADGDTNRGDAIRDALLFCGGAGSRLRVDDGENGGDENDGDENDRDENDGDRTPTALERRRGAPTDTGGVEREKPLVEVDGDRMVDRVLAGLDGSRIERVHAVVSPKAPATRAHARDLAADRDDLAVIETPGEGYVADLDRALAAVGTPALTVAADLPLLCRRTVDRALDAAERAADGGPIPSLTVCVPAALKRRLGASVDTAFVPADEATVAPPRYAGRELVPTGLNVVEGATAATDGADGSVPGEATWVSHDARLAVNVNRPSDLQLARTLAGGGERR